MQDNIEFHASIHLHRIDMWTRIDADQYNAMNMPCSYKLDHRLPYTRLRKSRMIDYILTHTHL